MARRFLANVVGVCAMPMKADPTEVTYRRAAARRPPAAASRAPVRAAADAPASGLGERVRGGVKRVLTAQKDRASQRLGEVAETMRRVAKPLREERYTVLGTYAERAADRLDRAARDLRHRDVDDLADDVRSVARRRPVAFVAAGFAAGVLAARFLKSSAPETERATANRASRSNGRG
jgi:hypothetical protein